MRNSLPLKLILIFIVFIISAGIMARTYYITQGERIFEEQSNNLAIVVKLKIEQIEQWRLERLGDARIIMTNGPLNRRILQYFGNEKDMVLKEEIVNWMDVLNKEFDYNGILILDNKINVRLSIPNQQKGIPDAIRTDIATAIKNNQIILTNLYWNGSGRNIEAALIIPFEDPDRIRSMPEGLVLIKIDPDQLIFPYINSWPTTSKSSETLIFQQMGDSVLYLNDLRYRKNSALSLSLPLSNKDLLASKVIRGDTGLIEGVDYRNVPVIGYAGRIPGLPWFMIAKVDKEELFAPLKTYYLFTLIVTVLLIMVCAAVTGFYFWNQKVQLCKNYSDELENQVKMRTCQLEAMNKDLESFSYSVSHDLRVPLRAILSFTKILKEEYESKLDSEGKRICEIIISSAGQMSDLINELLSFAKIGRTNLNHENVDMKALAGSAFKDLTTNEDKRNITLELGNIQNFYGDAILLKLVWNNLISNAIKFTSKNESSKIEIKSIMNRDTITYLVKDNGVGFDMEYSHKLFGIFQRLHSEHEFEGNGVGLAIVKKIISKHDGKIWAEGEVGKGSVFYFSMPVAYYQTEN